MRLPRLNSLTGLRWWRHASPRDNSAETILRQEAEITRRLRSPEPCAIGKIGTTELLGLEFFTRWIRPPWPPSASWRRPAQRLYECSGLFPVRRDIFFSWVRLYREALASLDIAALWQPGKQYEAVLEKFLLRKYNPSCSTAGISFVRMLVPRAGWIDDLTPLRWLVIHPFAETIRAQLPHLAKIGVYSESTHRDLDQRALDTRISPCPQFAYMVPPRHRDWFEALEEMKRAMEKQHADFDLVLVGAGAWSLPLVAHAKRLGKKGLHLGGALQLLFGIKGGRYDRWGVYNQAWRRPLNEEVPSNFLQMEKGAYW